MKNNTNCLYESQEQELIFKWIRSNQIKFPKLQLAYSTLNGVRLRPKLRADMKKQGLKAGVPDIVLPAGNKYFSGLYIELKRKKGGKVSKEQKEYLEKLREEGFQALVCRGHVEAIEAVKNYLIGA
ncbi:MAG: VRR-NUC domain-containing protein [Candidatus Muiribacteriota bacterium]